MGEMNKHVSPQELARTLQEFEKQSAKMDMSEEISMIYAITFVNSK